MNFREILIRIIGMTTPYVYDNNISLLELVRRLYKFVNELATCVQDLDKEFTDLKEYVDNYFNNLDISSEIKTVLNEMIEDGTLAEIINDELLGNINNEITSINEALATVNSTLQAQRAELTYLTYRDRFQVATCSANSNYVITNSDFTIQNDDVIFIHFNEALDGTKDATLTINGIAKSVITKEGTLYKGSDIGNQDIILRVTDAGLIQVVDILYFQEQINDNKESIVTLTNNLNTTNTNIGNKDTLNTTDKSSLVNAINEVNNKSDENTTDINSIKSFLNLNNQIDINLAECPVSDGSIDLANSSFNVVTNADKTYLKAYGYIRVENITNPINFINITLPDIGIRPTENITVRPCGNTIYSGNIAGRHTTMILKTDGTIDLRLNGSGNSHPSILGYFIPFLIYVENFGD